MFELYPLFVRWTMLHRSMWSLLESHQRMSSNGSTFEVEYDDRRNTKNLTTGGFSSLFILSIEKSSTIRDTKLIKQNIS